MASVRLPHQHAASAAPDSQRLRRYSQDLYGFILRYRALCDVHVVDLLVRPRGDVVPAAWLDALEVLGERGLTRLASGLEEAKARRRNANPARSSFGGFLPPQRRFDFDRARRVQCSWPEDLQVFLRLAAALPLPQVQDCSLSASKEGEADGYSRCRKANDKMNDKKLHEVGISHAARFCQVSRLSELVWRLATEKGIKAVVDVGAGQGYLSRALAYEHGLDVLAVDSDTVQTCGAQKTQARDQSKFRSMLDETADEGGVLLSFLAARWPVGTQAAGRIGSLRHITCHVSTSTIADTLREDLLMLRKPDFAGWNDSSISEQPPKCVHPADYLLTGLHACGNLTPDILRLFATEREAGAVAVVGCCYNFLTEVFDHESSGGTEPTVPGPPGASPSHGHPGFPMSRFGIDCGFRLGVRARQLACQVPMRWESKAEESREAFRRNFFRAALQVAFSSLFYPVFLCFVFLVLVSRWSDGCTRYWERRP
ncbi:MAG: methyltransferase domain-containing protein [Olpidium bornovanus]|uniref:Methyltransferase domain-containing protein n=1 Tax=Olpidium bornovanus TaxID=278681 RepID=A0A8H8DJ79_9FUNG|nr:MAG: methyltransferase domain-containing protein [Olpidium bornovanus]